jgi:arylamine N-acetyltransferase
MVDAYLDRISTRRPSGLCYELNGAFAALLSALGLPVTLPTDGALLRAYRTHFGIVLDRIPPLPQPAVTT